MFVLQEKGNHQIANFHIQSHSKIINKTIITVYMNILCFKTHIGFKILKHFRKTQENQAEVKSKQ